MPITDHLVQANEALIYGLGLAASFTCALTGVLVARDAHRQLPTREAQVGRVGHRIRPVSALGVVRMEARAESRRDLSLRFLVRDKHQRTHDVIARRNLDRPAFGEHFSSARLVADSSAAQATLGWKPMLADLSTIVQHAWAWESKQVATNQ